MTDQTITPQGDGELTPEEKANLENNNKPDYEALLAQEREKREKAEQAAADAAFKLREKKRKPVEVEPDNDDGEDKPLTRAELQAVLAQERQERQKERHAEQIVEGARKLAASDEEAQFIIEIHRNRQFPEGLSLPEQLAEAKAIAGVRANRFKAENDELKRALRSRDTSNKAPIRGEQNLDDMGGSGKAPTFKGKDAEAMKSSGYVWDGKEGLYKKTTKEGKTIVYNPETKKTSVLKSA